ncbi:MAG: ribosome silencing factor [Candidatus Cloacimonas sp. 4484_275]|nr:MAG: ribosome silencing factor [Candidatus Cloacimonas sp. 4484_275]RLC51884.1 MAG: ribosome silencing factor [Candidatus Cloacimonadota bacterium]
MEPKLEEKVASIINWMKEKKAENIVSINVAGKSDYTDYLIICSGSGELHNRAIADNIKDKAEEHDFGKYAVEGYDNGVWILMDFIDIIVHIFTEEKRKYYEIEDIWNINSKRFSEKKEENGQR